MFMSRPRGGSVKSQAALVENNDENVELELDQNKNSKCAGCSFERTAMLGTLLTIALVGILVITLDVAIDHSRRLAQIEHSKALVNDSYILHGTPDEYAVFYPLDYYESQRARRIDMNYVQLNLTDFLLSYQFTRKPDSIQFRNMRFVGKISKGLRHGLSGGPRTRHIITSWADEMIIEFNQSVGPFANFQLDRCDKCILNVSNPDNLNQFQDVDCLKSAFILPDDSGSNYFMASTRQLLSRMKVKVFDWNFFEFDLHSLSLTSMHRDTDKILENFRLLGITEFKQLHLRNCDIRGTTLLQYHRNLTHLTLDEVNVTQLPSLRLSQIISSLTQLEELTVKFGNALVGERAKGIHTQYVNDPNPFVIDFTELPSSLKVLRLSNVLISSQNYKPDVTQVHLNLELLVIQDTLFEDESSWDMIQDPGFLKYNRFAWQNVNSWYFRSLHPGSQASFEPKLSWFDFLKRKTSLADSTEWIFIDNVYDLGTDALPGAGANRTEMLEYWTSIGVPAEGLNSEALELKREGGSKGQWKGRHIDNSHLDLTSIWFNVLNMEVFLDKESRLTSEW